MKRKCRRLSDDMRRKDEKCLQAVKTFHLVCISHSTSSDVNHHFMAVKKFLNVEFCLKLEIHTIHCVCRCCYTTSTLRSHSTSTSTTLSLSGIRTTNSFRVNFVCETSRKVFIVNSWCHRTPHSKYTKCSMELSRALLSSSLLGKEDDTTERKKS